MPLYLRGSDYPNAARLPRLIVHSSEELTAETVAAAKNADSVEEAEREATPPHNDASVQQEPLQATEDLAAEPERRYGLRPVAVCRACAAENRQAAEAPRCAGAAQD